MKQDNNETRILYAIASLKNALAEPDEIKQREYIKDALNQRYWSILNVRLYNLQKIEGGYTSDQMVGWSTARWDRIEKYEDFFRH